MKKSKDCQCSIQTPKRNREKPSVSFNVVQSSSLVFLAYEQAREVIRYLLVSKMAEE